MKVIFLDVDGVLNTTAHLRHSDSSHSAMIGAEHVAQLQRIVDATGAHVVISSSWRHGMTYTEIGHLLESKGFRGVVIGQTPDYVTNPDMLGDLFDGGPFSSRYGCRGDEISAWLREAPNVEAFVVLDDDSDMRGVGHRHVRTTMADGLTAELADKAIALLNEPDPKEASA